MDVQRFGAFVAQRRRELGMTQSELAAKLFVTDKAVSKWERGLGFPDVNTLEPLAAALDVSLMELMNSQRDGGELSREQADGAVSEALGLARGRHMPLKKQLGLVIALCALALAFSLMLATANSVILTLLFLGGVVAGIGSAAMLVKGAGEAAGMYRVMLGASLCCVLLVMPGTDRFFERWSLWIDLALDVFIVAVMAKGMRLMLAERHRHSRRNVITLVLVYLFLIAANVQGGAQKHGGDRRRRRGRPRQCRRAVRRAAGRAGLRPASRHGGGRLLRARGGWLRRHGGRRRQDGAL